MARLDEIGLEEVSELDLITVTGDFVGDARRLSEGAQAIIKVQVLLNVRLRVHRLPPLQSQIVDQRLACIGHSRLSVERRGLGDSHSCVVLTAEVRLNFGKVELHDGNARHQLG